MNEFTIVVPDNVFFCLCGMNDKNLHLAEEHLGVPVFAKGNGLYVENVKRLFETGITEIAPLAYIRGRTLNNCVVILDDAQNATFSHRLLPQQSIYYIILRKSVLWNLRRMTL